MMYFFIEHYEIHVGQRLADLERELNVRLCGAVTCTGKGHEIVVCALPNGAAIPANLLPSSTRGILFVPSKHFPRYVQLLRKEVRVLCKLDESQPFEHALQSGESVAVGKYERTVQVRELPDLHAWLNTVPRIRDAIAWEGFGGTRTYSDWSNDQKADLRTFFELAWQNREVGLTDPPPNAAHLSDGSFPLTVLAESDAWPLFLSHVAQSLAVEAGGRVPWSIANESPDNLALLFDSRKTFNFELVSIMPSNEWEVSWGLWAYRIPNSFGFALPCPAQMAYHFLLHNHLIGRSALATIALTLEWCRDNLVHFSGSLDETSNMQDQWQYRGFPPVSRMIRGTPFTSRPEVGVEHRTAGCWGTSGFLRCVLRTINIPATLAERPSTASHRHALPHFPSVDRFLSHGDDPYNRNVRSALPNYSGELLLITGARFNEWFSDAVSETQQRKNIGRRLDELTLEHLPLELLRNHCEDLNESRVHASSRVFETLRNLDISVTDLENAGLWDRIERKIADLGGCDHLE